LKVNLFVTNIGKIRLGIFKNCNCGRLAWKPSKTVGVKEYKFGVILGTLLSKPRNGLVLIRLLIFEPAYLIEIYFSGQNWLKKISSTPLKIILNISRRVI